MILALKGATAMPTRRPPTEHAEAVARPEPTLVAALTASATEVVTVARRSRDPGEGADRAHTRDTMRTPYGLRRETKAATADRIEG